MHDTNPATHEPATHRTGRPTAAEADQRERDILDAALELLMEVGYDRFSIDALAERAHAGKATIYRRWPGKAALVVDAVRRRHADHQEPLPDTGSLRGDLIAAVGRMTDALTSRDGALLVGVMQAMHSDAELAEQLRTQVFESKYAAYQEIVDRAVSRGELTGTGGADAALEVLPAVIVTRLLILDLPADPSFADHVVDDILLPLLTHQTTQEHRP